ncbi:MAG: hypothetical protein ACRDGD_00500 [Candidatus Limnocylindria bacterium]
MNTRFTLARLWYWILAAAALLYAGSAILGPLLGGCRIALSQADMGLGSSGCVQYLDPFTTTAAIAVGLLALAAAAWVTSPGLVRGTLASIGIVAGMLASFVPLGLVVAVFAYYEATPGPFELLIGAVPVVLGVLAAIVMWRRSARPWDWSAGRGAAGSIPGEPERE